MSFHHTISKERSPTQRTAKYPVSFAAGIWGVSIPTAHNYVNRYLTLNDHDHKARGGATTLLTASTMMQGAIAAQMHRTFRWKTKLACKAAFEFAKTGNPPDVPYRLYSAGTALIASASGEAKIVSMNDCTIMQPVRKDAIFIVLLLDGIVARVTKDLMKFDKEMG